MIRLRKALLAAGVDDQMGAGGGCALLPTGETLAQILTTQISGSIVMWLEVCLLYAGRTMT